MHLPEDFLQELIYRCNIADIVSGYVNLKRNGRNLVGLCPFHNEKTPSFNLYTENNSFYCFGCGAGGNIINFIMRIENLDYIDAVQFLAQRVGMNMPQDSYDDSMSNLRKRIFEANRQAARFYYNQLYTNSGKNGLDYLRGRALSENTIRHFGLGFAPNTGFELCNHLKKLGFTDNELVSANLAVKNRSGNGIHDRFYNRVMFPIIDLRGNVIAFGGRIMTDQKPKYLNTSDTPVFKKSTNIFSLNNAKNTGEKKLILCEGYMDVIAVNQAGFQNAVATLGTALTSEQASLMKRYADEVIICYDADEAGQKATARAIDILRNTGILIKVLNIPDGKDPDEFIRKKGSNGPAAFKNLLDSSGNDIEYQLSKAKRLHNLQTSEGKIAYLNNAVKILASLESPIERDVYASKLSEELEVQKDAILQQILKQVRRKSSANSKNEFRKLQEHISGRDDTINKQRHQVPRGAKAEEALLSYLINNPDMINEINAKLPQEKFLTEFNKKLYGYFSERINNGLNPTTAIASDFTSQEAGRIAEIMASYNKQIATKDAVNEYINVILDENKKPSEHEIASASNEELLSFLQKIKEQKSKQD